MERDIVGFRLDEHGDMVAELDCHHGRHVRHHPPFDDRPWTLTEAGRAEMIGRSMVCVRCERGELPEGLTEYKRTPEFTDQTVPAGLLRDHSTKRGTWGIIRVLDGALQYTITEGELRSMVLEAGDEGVVVPQQKHHVRPLGAVRFYVAFLGG